MENIIVGVIALSFCSLYLLVAMRVPKILTDLLMPLHLAAVLHVIFFFLRPHSQ